MRSRLIASIVLLSAGFCFAQQSAPLGRLLERRYPQLADDDEALVWVYFKDKGALSEEKLLMAPTTLVSERAVRRRQKVLGTQQLFDTRDLPLKQSYVSAVGTIVTKVRHEAKWFNALSAVATKRQIEQLRQLPYVSMIDLVVRHRRRVIEENLPIEPSHPQPTSGNPLIGYGGSLTQNHQIKTDSVHSLGVTGQGVLIGVFDAGFSNLTHPALVTRPIVARYDFVTNSTVLGSHSHGQNTFSVIGGFSDGNLVGPAYGASFVLARTEDATPETPIEEDNWVRAIIWADSIGIDVASTSLGYGDFHPPWPDYTWQDMDGTTSVITRAADRAVSLGIVVVNSAGNGGTVSLPANTLGAPADGFDVIAAGAVTSAGVRSSFSSVGPTSDGRIKPDVMAMGSSVWAASGTSSYTGVSGTSFSCPLTAGVAALVVCANPDATPLQVREAMRQTATRAANPDREYGWGILDALKAVNYAWIEHAPLLATEDAGPRDVVVTIKSRIPLVADSTRVIYGIGGVFTGSAVLNPTSTPNEYTAQIPSQGSGITVSYYIIAKNASVSTLLPLNAPAEYFSYVVSPDAEGPVIAHAPLGNQSVFSWPPRVSATVTDPAGLDSVKVEWSVNAQQLAPFSLGSLGGDLFADTFHLGRNDVNVGDTVAYRIVAIDGSAGNNTSLYPTSGYVRFAILSFQNVSETFKNSNGGFAGTNDWEWGFQAGTSPPPFSPSRYWGTVLGGDYTVGPRLSSLTSGTYVVFSDYASFAFQHWYEIQSRFDGANIKVSIDGGPFQVVTPIGGYPTASIYSGFGNPLADEPGFSNVGGNAWSQVRVDLTGLAVAGNTIAVRLDFGADNGIQYRGWYIDDFTSDGFGFSVPVATKDQQAAPRVFALHQNFPNPFNPTTVISFQLPVLGPVRLAVHNLLGQEVAVLVDGVEQPGTHEVRWDATSFPTGVYFYRLQSGNLVDTRKLLLVK